MQSTFSLGFCLPLCQAENASRLPAGRKCEPSPTSSGDSSQAGLSAGQVGFSDLEDPLPWGALNSSWRGGDS